VWREKVGIDRQQRNKLFLAGALIPEADDPPLLDLTTSTYNSNIHSYKMSIVQGRTSSTGATLIAYLQYLFDKSF